MIRWWLLLGFVLAAQPASAGDKGSLERAISLFEEMEYGAACEAAGQALASPQAGPGSLVQAYRIQGLCLSALGKGNEALDAFRRLLAIDSAFRLSADISPKLAAPFYQAVAMARSQDPIRLVHRRPQPPEKLGGLVLRIKLKSNPFGMVNKIRMRFVTADENSEKQMAASVSGAATLGMRLPRDLKAAAVRYYFEAVNRHGGVLARRGSRQEPIELRVRLAPQLATAVLSPPRGESVVEQRPAVNQREESTPWYKTWWFWTTVSVVIVGSTTAAILAADAEGQTGPVDYGIRLE